MLWKSLVFIKNNVEQFTSKSYAVLEKEEKKEKKIVA